VARDLGVVSSAVYRYVASRDDLLTLLVVDGYDELGDAVDAAVARVDPADHRGRLMAIGRAVRTWAVAEPATYALLFGSPVPGYHAPAERTTGPGTFSLATGGNSGGWNAIPSLGNPTLTNTWTITYVVGESLSFTIGGITYDFSANIPSWENISIGFRIYNASTTLTLSNFDYSISSIPEPSTLTLLTLSGIGITAFLLRKRRMQAKS
jgi:hypothetical protein